MKVLSSLVPGSAVGVKQQLNRRAVGWEGERAAPLSPPQTTARLASLASFFSSFSSNAEPVPRLGFVKLG